MKLTEIKIKNFKNVRHGKISVPEKAAGEGASILAIYGQNGSGKTAIVDALAIFRELVQGKPIPERFASFIRQGTEASFEYTFACNNDELRCKYLVKYEVVFRAQKTGSDNPWTIDPNDYLHLSCIVVSERLRYSSIGENGTRIRMHDAAAASEEKGVWPKKFVEALSACKTRPGLARYIEERKGRRAEWEARYAEAKAFFDEKGVPEEDPERIAFLEVTKDALLNACEDLKFYENLDREIRNAEVVDFSECHAAGKSYVFQEAILGLFSFDFSSEKALASVLKAVKHQKIAITGTDDEGQLSLNRLHFYSMRNIANAIRIESFSRREIPLSKEDIEASRRDRGLSPTVVDLQVDPYEENEMDVAEVENVLRSVPYLNIVLESIVPGLNIELRAGEPDQDGICRTQWYSIRKCPDGSVDYSIPLANESHGVQRIVGWAMLLVNVYNDSDFIAVIDEIDAGIFEYLLGEILDIIESEGRGQLVFTSHNLRPLEMLDKNSVVFTTTNPENRYIRLKNVKPTNNLRDMYFRAITLDNQDETLYDYVSRARLGSAFSRAHIDELDETIRYIVDASIRDLTREAEEKGSPLTTEEIEQHRASMYRMMREERSGDYDE